MDDIIKNFPTAEEIRGIETDKIKEEFFKRELQSIYRLILWGKERGFHKISLSTLSDEGKKFLSKKGYKIYPEGDCFWVRWN